MYVYRYINRLTIIPFQNELSYHLENVQNVSNQMEQLPSTVRELLSIGHKIINTQPTDQEELKAFVIDATNNAIGERLAVGYARLLWITIEVLNRYLHVIVTSTFDCKAIFRYN